MTTWTVKYVKSFSELQTGEFNILQDGSSFTPMLATSESSMLLMFPLGN